MICKVGLRQIEPIKARRPAIQPAEAITPPLHFEERLYLSVNKKLVSQNAVPVGQIKSEHAVIRIEVLVIEHHRDIKIREARKPKPRRLIAGVELIKEQIKTGEALVDVLSREVYAVVVIPERAHRLVDVPQWWMTRGESGEDVRIMLVVPLGLPKEVARETI